MITQFKTWFLSLTKTEQAAIATLGGICFLILMFTMGMKVGAAFSGALS